MYMLVAFLGGAGGKSAKNVECAGGGGRKKSDINLKHFASILV